MITLGIGRLTNHKKFNEATAILAGDALLNFAYMIISKELLNCRDNNLKDKKIRAFRELSFSVDRMIAGEYIDTEFEGKDISSDYLEYMHKNKTGALIMASCRIGAILAGASSKDLELISSYAENIGLAFQIKDDILSEIGDEKVLGKPVGNDREKCKVTFVTKYGLERAKEILDENIKNAIRIIEKFGNKSVFLRDLALYIENREK